MTRGAKGTTENFVEKARKIHGDRYNYDKFTYTGIHNKGDILCDEHGIFPQEANAHLKGQGCPICNSESNKLGKIVFVEKARLIHGDLYDYSEFEYVHSKIVGKIRCRKHNEIFVQSPNSHLRGRGCRLCGNIKISLSKQMSEIDFKEKANSIHENFYNYDKFEYKGCYEKGIIICPIHNEFIQRPYSHLSGQGCPECGIIKAKSHGFCFISKPETEWLNHLNVPVRQYVIQTCTKKINVDGYDPETNTVYQFHGDYWHGNPEIFDPSTINQTTGCTMNELYQRTLENDQLIRESGYNLAIAWENDYYEGFYVLWENDVHTIISMV